MTRRNFVLVRSLVVLTAVLAVAGTVLATDSYTDLPARPGSPEAVKVWRQLIPGGGQGIPDGDPGRAQTFFTDRTAFDAAAPGLPVEDFQEGNVAAGNVATCSDPYDSTTSDACWSAGDILPGMAVGSSSAGGTVILGAGFFGGSSTISTGANTFTDYTYINFAPSVTAAGMDILPAGPVEIRMYDESGTLLNTASANGSDDGAFWGVISDETIFRIELEGVDGAGEIFDNLAFGTAGPALIVDEITFDDVCFSGNGDANGIAEPNELLELYLQVTASGGDFTNVAGNVTSVTPGVTIVAGSYNYGTVTDGSAVTNTMPYELILDGLQCGDTLDVEITVTSTEGGAQVVQMSTSVGQPLEPTVPLDIPDDDTGGIASPLVVADDVSLTDVDVYVEIDHTWVGDVVVWLESPAGTIITLLDRPGEPASTFGCSDDNMAITFDDDSAFDPEDYCSGSDPWYSGDAMPVTSLATLNGESTAGTWRLWVNDNAAGDTGQIVDWALITTPGVSGVCEPCEEPVPVQLEAIPTLNQIGLFALISLLGLAAVFVIRRR